MIKLLTTIGVLLLALPPAYSQDAKTRVAKVDYSEVESLVETVVLAKPENRELGERFKAQVAKIEEAQKQMQKAILSGEKFNPLEASLGMHGESRESKKVDALCEKHLLELIETTFEGKYDIILRESYHSSLLFTRIAIDDVTVILKQELLKQLPAVDAKSGKKDAGNDGLEKAQRDVELLTEKLKTLSNEELIAEIVPGARVKKTGGYRYYYGYMANAAIRKEISSRDSSIIPVLEKHSDDDQEIADAVNAFGWTVGGICKGELLKRREANR